MRCGGGPGQGTVSPPVDNKDEEIANAGARWGARQGTVGLADNKDMNIAHAGARWGAADAVAPLSRCPVLTAVPLKMGCQSARSTASLSSPSSSSPLVARASFVVSLLALLVLIPRACSVVVFSSVSFY